MFQSDNKVKELKCRSVIHRGFKKGEKKKVGLRRNKGPSAFRLRVQSHHFSLSLRLGLYQRHYPSLVSVTHLVVAPIIVFEGAIITGKVAREGFETSETMWSDKDKFSPHVASTHTGPGRVVFLSRAEPRSPSPSSLCTAHPSLF